MDYFFVSTNEIFWICHCMQLQSEYIIKGSSKKLTRQFLQKEPKQHRVNTDSYKRTVTLVLLQVILYNEKSFEIHLKLKWFTSKVVKPITNFLPVKSFIELCASYKNSRKILSQKHHKEPCYTEN